jgi:hypothetical protein
MPEREMAVDDREVATDRAYWYRLRLVAHSGEESLAGPVEAPIPGAVPFVRLFAPTILGTDKGIPIRYQIAGRGTPVRLEVFTASGRLLRVLDRRFALPGEHLVSWDAASSGGNRAARGTYFVRLATDHGSATTKVVLLHR